MKTKVYIAGPITGSGDRLVNIREALQVGSKLIDLGYAPYIPHRDALDQLVTGRSSWTDWMEQDHEWLSVCHVVLRLPGESPGADKEVMWALDKGIAVVSSIEHLLTFHGPTKDDTCTL